jgi:ferredoxin
MLDNFLENGKFFKLVCGAGNEDEEYVKRLVYVYAKAGCRVFDISARISILETAKSGAALANVEDAHYCVSVGIKGDTHIAKAEISNSYCTKCGNCARTCPNNAIYFPNIIDNKKCIGCGSCIKKCPTGAIKMYEKDVNVKEILPKMIEQGVEILELHIMGNDDKDLEYKWSVINECNPKFASICVDRSKMGNFELLEKIKSMIKERTSYTTIIQADGIPMSGSEDDFKTTLQAVAMGEIIQNEKLPVYIVLSGGTNSKTAELCRLCSINSNGVAIGSYARKIVSKYINDKNFWNDENLQKIAIEKAKELCNTIL